MSLERASGLGGWSVRDADRNAMTGSLKVLKGRRGVLAGRMHRTMASGGWYALENHSANHGGDSAAGRSRICRRVAGFEVASQE